MIVHDTGALLGAGDNAVDGLVQGAVVDELGVGASGEQGRLVEDIGQVGAGEAGRALGHQVEVDVAGHRFALGVHAQDGGASSHIGGLDADLPVETAGPQEGGIQDVGAVGGGDEDNVGVGIEAVHLDEQLVEGLLALIVPAAHAGPAVAANGVDLVDEDDGRRVLLGLLEQVTHARGAHSDEHLDEFRAGHGEEGHAGLAGDCLGEQGLPGPGRAVQQDALGDLGAHGLELLGFGEELADLLQLLDRLVLAGDIVEGDVGHLLGAHLRLGPSETHGPAAASAHPPQQPPHDSQEDGHRQQQLEHGGPPARRRDDGVEAARRVGRLDEVVDLMLLGLGVVELDLLAHGFSGFTGLGGRGGVILGQVEFDALVAVDNGDGFDGRGVVPEDRQTLGGVDRAVAAQPRHHRPHQKHDQDEGRDPQQGISEHVAAVLVPMLGAALVALLRGPGARAVLSGLTGYSHRRWSLSRVRPPRR